MKKFKFVATLILGLMFSSMAMAGWEVPGAHFGLTKGAVSAIVAPPAGGDVELITIPTAALGYGVDNGATPCYGFYVDFDQLLCGIAPGDGANVQVTSFLGVGGAIFFDAGPCLNSTFQQPIVARIGINIIGPEIQGIVPGVMETFDLNTGDRKVSVNMNAPFDLFSGAITRLVKF